MTYKQCLINTMTALSKYPEVIFIGYNVKYGHKFNGTLINVPDKKLLEMPVAENLIMGMAMGMALEGYCPIVCIERINFLWVCADAIINHLDKAKELGWPPLNVIIRTCVGTDKPLDPGCQHKGDYTKVWGDLLAAPVKAIKTIDEIAPAYDEAYARSGPSMIVEYRELYDTPHPTHGVK